MLPRQSRNTSLILAALFTPSASLAAEPLLTPALVFVDAAPFQKLLILALVGAVVAAGVIAARKLSPSASPGGSAFIAGLRSGGPLVGALGATYSSLNSAVGVANLRPQDLSVLAPGIAESLLVLALGLLAGAVAVTLHAMIASRIARRPQAA